MSNFGFWGLRLVDAYEVAYKEARSAVNASAVLASSEQFASIAEAVADCSLVVGTASKGNRELRHTMHRLEHAAPLIRNAAGSLVALLFGSEKFGLSNEELAHCHWVLRIPTRHEHESMNLGQAVAVCLYELIRDEKEAVRIPQDARPASAGDEQRITERLIRALRISGYMQEDTASSSEEKVHRLVRRMQLREKDAVVLLGMLRQILWKLGEKP